MRNYFCCASLFLFRCQAEKWRNKTSTEWISKNTETKTNRGLCYFKHIEYILYNWTFGEHTSQRFHFLRNLIYFHFQGFFLTTGFVSHFCRSEKYNNIWNLYLQWLLTYLLFAILKVADILLRKVLWRIKYSFCGYSRRQRVVITQSRHLLWHYST